MKNIKLYNVFFPIWFLLLFPITWLIAMPINFVIDSIVILLSLKFLKIDDIFQKYKKVILKVFLFVFTSLVGRLEEQSGLFKWINKKIIESMMRSPFENIYAFLLVAIAVIIAGLCIYYLNLKNSFSKIDLEAKDKKKLAFYMAIFTAPYFFFVPTSVIYNLPT